MPFAARKAKWEKLLRPPGFAGYEIETIPLVSLRGLAIYFQFSSQCDWKLGSALPLNPGTSVSTDRGTAMKFPAALSTGGRINVFPALFDARPESAPGISKPMKGRALQ